jgi:hypothetical protein
MLSHYLDGLEYNLIMGYLASKKDANDTVNSTGYLTKWQLPGEYWSQILFGSSNNYTRVANGIITTISGDNGGQISIGKDHIGGLSIGNSSSSSITAGGVTYSFSDAGAITRTNGNTVVWNNQISNFVDQTWISQQGYATQTWVGNQGYLTGSHNQAASTITSGTFDIARIPTGTSSSTVALGNHGHDGYAPAFTVATGPLTYSNNVIGISQASANSWGFLGTADWVTFNGKADKSSVSTTYQIISTVTSYIGYTVCDIIQVIVTNGIITSSTTIGSLNIKTQ